MRVLFVQGGSPHYFVKVLNQLNKKNEIHVITPFDSKLTIGSGVHQDDSKSEYTIHRLIEKKAFYGKPCFVGIRSKIKEVNPDLLIIGWPFYLQILFSVRLLLFLKYSKIKLVGREIPFKMPAWDQSFESFRATALQSTKHELIYNSRIVYKFHKLIFKILYKNIFNAGMCYTDEGYTILGSYGMKKENIFITLNSPDTNDLFQTIDNLKTKQLNKKKNRIIHVGRLVFWKRVDLLINAVDILKNEIPDIELIIVGKGEEENNLKQQVEKLGLNEYIKFIGAIYNEEELCFQFQQSDLYVLAGMGGLSINEAMCNSLPVICSVCDGTEKHLVKDGFNGYFFNSDDLQDLVDKIRAVLINESLKLEMGKNSFDIIQKSVNINEVVKRYDVALAHIEAIQK